MPHLLSAARANESIYPENVLYLGAGQPAPGMRLAERPEPNRVAGWLLRAELEREAVLTRFDVLLITGSDAMIAAQQVVTDFLRWTRATAAEFVSGAAYDPLTTTLRAQEKVLWDLLAESAAVGAVHDPGTVDRFLRVWLTVLHEAIRTGNASLYALP
jgi:hypothetical protein